MPQTWPTGVSMPLHSWTAKRKGFTYFWLHGSAILHGSFRIRFCKLISLLRVALFPPESDPLPTMTMFLPNFVRRLVTFALRNNINHNISWNYKPTSNGFLKGNFNSLQGSLSWIKYKHPMASVNQHSS